MGGKEINRAYDMDIAKYMLSNMAKWKEIVDEKEL